MIEQQIVSHFRDGRVLKGLTTNFVPNRPSFHMRLAETGERVQVDVDQLKGVFFVKDFDGRPDYNERQDIERPGFGRRISVTFVDSETIVGHTQGYSPERRGFFLAPADPESNNARVFVVKAATTAITLH